MMPNPMTPEKMAQIHAAAFADTRPWSVAEFTTLQQATDVIYVQDGTGFALARHVLDEAELLTIAIPPKAQGHGRGTALLGELETRLRQNGTTRIFLEVAENNAPARTLYARAGYREIARRKGYYHQNDGQNVDCLVMEKPLPYQNTGDLIL